MKTSKIKALIKSRTQNRFDVSVDESLAVLAGPSLTDIHALKVRRAAKPDTSGRTILLAAIDKIEDWNLVASWTAQVRDMLPEPETSDLYLILLAEGFSQHNLSRLEADEQFCRKYVASNIDDIPLLLDRTFMASLSTSETGTAIVDPVTAAFLATQTKHPWLTNTLQEQWLKTFLSDKTGKDLVPEIIENVAPKMDL